MKTAVLTARYLLGVSFLIFGLNGLFHFIPLPPPRGLTEQSLETLFVSHDLIPIFLLQIVGGALLLANCFIPLPLALLGLAMMNILLFHPLISSVGLILAVILVASWAVAASSVCRSLESVLIARGGV